MLHFNTIRKYTLALLTTFNNLKVEYKLEDGTYDTKTVPLKYASVEKSKLLGDIDTQELLNGNYNVLPRASLAMSTMTKFEQRSTNKFVKNNNIETSDTTRQFTYNPVPYEITFELTILCRGMNEASMIVEQIVTKFNPNYSIRINEVPGQSEPSTIPISLLDVAIEQSEYEDISTNLVTISVGLSVKANFYPPIQTVSKVNEMKMYVNIWESEEQKEIDELLGYGFE